MTVITSEKIFFVARSVSEGDKREIQIQYEQ